MDAVTILLCELLFLNEHSNKRRYVYWGSPDNNLIDTVYRTVYCSHQDAHDVCGTGAFAGVHEKYAMLVWILCRIAFWIGVAGVLHWRGWYWAL